MEAPERRGFLCPFAQNSQRSSVIEPADGGPKRGELWALDVTVKEEGVHGRLIQNDCGSNATDSPAFMR